MKGPSPQLWRGALYAALAAFVLVAIIELIKLGAAPSASQPGVPELRQATATIGAHHATAYGNGDKATTLAGQMSTFMKAFRDKDFTHLKRKAFGEEDDEFCTYCQLQEGHCAFLIHVPELRRFNFNAKRTLSQGAWFFAQKLMEKEGKPVHLAIALQGRSSCERVLVGHYIPGTKLKGEAHNFNPEKQLIPWFVPQPAATNESPIK
jgi:hypothetical protein